MNTDEHPIEIDKKVDLIITRTEKENKNRKALRKGLLIVLSVAAGHNWLPGWS
ncbi:hypothetical protein F6Y05_37695 [Bacillus megaterium]|nr:hypothetical protein [Priestia megaterium]